MRYNHENIYFREGATVKGKILSHKKKKIAHYSQSRSPSSTQDFKVLKHPILQTLFTISVEN